MAEVLVTTQTIQNIMLHPTDSYHANSSTQSHHSNSRGSQVPRGYGSHSVGVPYRGMPTNTIPQYAFQSTPNLRQDIRTSSAPAVQRQSVVPGIPLNHRQNYAPSSSESTASTNSASNSSSNVGQYTLSKDDTVVGGKVARPESTFLTSSSTPDLSLISFNETAKPSPDRYRRTASRTNSGNNVATLQTAQQGGNNPRFSQQWPTPQGGSSGPFHAAVPGHNRVESADNVLISRQSAGGPHRRRSINNPDLNAAHRPGPSPGGAAAPTWSQVVARGHSGPVAQAIPVISANASRPIGQHHRNDSGGSHSSVGSNTVKRPASARQDSYGSTKSNGGSSRPNTAPSLASRKSPSRNTSEMNKRTISPSPLSKPVSTVPEKRPATANPAILVSPAARPTAATPQSPAVQQLHALSERDPNKNMKSRLRRAFSFGSAQELRKASAQNSANRLRKEQPATDELADEDAIVAAQQEAAGIGAGIYSGQGVVFGSTDNLSISSTASSASIMLRKMGQGMKKSTKSLRGLFRPKSIIGDPVADNAVPAPSVSAPEVSRVTVEAERKELNVNTDPHDQPGGGTGFPKFESASIEAPKAASFDRPTSSRHGQTDSVSSRKSIVGSDKDRQEVLAAVKKGILKRNNTSSPVPAEPNQSDMGTPSLPGTPDGIINPEDYFVANRFGNGSTRSLPEARALARNISWNPKVQFHDVYPSNEYDRRGDIATCNRLTPMLAQQIKEELNSFKMEMEVHEESKPHTHFF